MLVSLKGGDDMKNNNLSIWVVVGVALIVAVIASLATSSIVGKSILVSQYSEPSTSSVYTKYEIDKMGFINWRNITSNLNFCTVVKDYQTSGTVSCNTICNSQMNGPMICVLGQYGGTITSCSDSSGSINTVRFCNCCYK